MVDAFSRLSKIDPPTKVPKELKRPINTTSVMDNRDPPEGPLSIAFYFSYCDLEPNAKGKNTATPFNINNEQYLSMTEDDELLDCFLNLPQFEPGTDTAQQNPLNFKWLEFNQGHDARIQE